MYVEHLSRLLNAKVVYFACYRGRPTSVECAGEVYVRGRPSMRISARERDDGWIFVLQPKHLRGFTPRFHLFASSAETFDDDAFRLLLSGADGVVLVVSGPVPDELAAVRDALGPRVPIVLQLFGAVTADVVASIQAAHPQHIVAPYSTDAFVEVCNAIAIELARDAPDPQTAEELAGYASLPFVS